MSGAWLDLDTDGETLDETEARGGALSAVGRKAAIAATLPLLGLYFTSGEQPLTVSPTLGKAVSGSLLHELLAGLRLRVALAAAARLEIILSRISERPTFRYQLTSLESVGAITGQLDVNRYTTSFGAVAEAPIYPVIHVERAQETAENVLVAYAALWLLRELHSSYQSSVAPATAPEAQEYGRRTRALDELLRLPWLAGCIRKADEVRRRQDEHALIAAAKSRLRRREIANATPYRELVNWIERSLEGQPAAESGDLDWSFYGDRFDTKLFELWCLHTLAQEVSRQLCVNMPTVHLSWRSGDAAYKWERPAGTLTLHFQRSISSISSGHKPEWRRREDNQRSLGGIPDIVAHATKRSDGTEHMAIIDPKLRQRGGPPTEELYKVLGYLSNHSLMSSPRGAILYHTTAAEGELPSYSYERHGASGALHAVALNPARPIQSRSAIGPVATMLLGLLDIPPLLASVGKEPIADNDSEASAEVQVRARSLELQALAAAMPKSLLDASKRRLETVIGKGRWTVLTSEIQTMLATSEHVGFSLDPAADFSGPVIGICASAENILHDYIFGPAIAHNTQLGNGYKTLGQVIHATLKALNNGNEELHQAILAQLNRMNVVHATAQQLMQDLANMNRRYRIPAAHRDLVSEATWQAAWNVVIGPTGLLARAVDVLILGTPPSPSL
ncbi:hypothetical protein ABZW11_14240 [Nonomuraea sp. NPDC004580]|uniref:hypothetical protein n=1 Tax=Nonomuraea sp. NPDC004580 TaxID=3154552 RepID=UPI0033A7155A